VFCCCCKEERKERFGFFGFIRSVFGWIKGSVGQEEKGGSGRQPGDSQQVSILFFSAQQELKENKMRVLWTFTASHLFFVVITTVYFIDF